MEVEISGGPPWGFSLVGGIDFRSPLRISKVSANGKADKAGVKAGHYILKINGVDCANLKHMEAQRLVKTATGTLELQLTNVEMRKKSSQSNLSVEPRRQSTSSLPRGMSSLSSLGSHRLSFHDDQSAFMRSPRSSASSIGGDFSVIPSKPLPPPSRPAPPPSANNQPTTIMVTDTTDTGKLSSETTTKEPSPAMVATDDVFGSVIEEEEKPSDTKCSTTTTTTGSSSLSFIRAAVKKPPVVAPKKPSKPVAKEEKPVTAQPEMETTTKPATDTATQPVAETVTKPVAEVKTQPIAKPVTKEETSTQSIVQESRWQSSKRRTSKEGPAGHIPSVPKSEGGGGSWYKSMMKSMLANDDSDDVTIPLNAASPPTQRRKSSSSDKATISASTWSTATQPAPTNTTTSVTVKQPAKPVPPSPAKQVTKPAVVTPPAPAVSVKQQQQPEQPLPASTVKVTEPVDLTPVTTSHTVAETSEDAVPSNEPIDTDSMEFMTTEQVRAAIRQTLSGTSSNKGWKMDIEKDTPSYTSHASNHTPSGGAVHEKRADVTAEDIHLNKMHPIISDVTLSEGVAPTVSVTSPTTDVPVNVVTTEPVQTQPNTISQSDLSDVQLDKMHPIISGAISSDIAMTTEHVEKTTSDEVMIALEELNDVIASTGHTPPPDHITAAVSGNGSRSSSRHSNVSDSHRQTVTESSDHSNRGSRSNSRQSNTSNHENKGSRSNSRQSNHDNRASRGSSVSSEEKRKRKSPPAASAKALYSFSGQSVKEVSFKKGTVIKLTATVDNNWLEGEVDGVKGIFPRSYVELISGSGTSTPLAVATPEASKSPTPGPPTNDQPHAIAKFKFEAVSDKELSFQKGDTLYLSKRVDDNWYRGHNAAGDMGIFPCSYVQVVVDIPEKVEYVKSDTPPIEAEMYPDGEIQTSRKTPPPRSAKQPMVTKAKPDEQDGQPDVDVTTTTSSFDVPGERYEALFSYIPKNSDELGLDVGDMVVVFERCDDGWFMGTCERTGDFGAFPGNYVKKLD